MRATWSTDVDLMHARILLWRYAGAHVHEDIDGPTGRAGTLADAVGRRVWVRTPAGTEFTTLAHRLVVDAPPPARPGRLVRSREPDEPGGLYLMPVLMPLGDRALVELPDGTTELLDPATLVGDIPLATPTLTTAPS